MVAPVATLGTVALVWGYEKIDLEARFSEVRSEPFVGLVPQTQAAPLGSDKLKAVLHVGLLGLFLGGLSPEPFAMAVHTPLSFAIASTLAFSALVLKHQKFAQITESGYQMVVLLLANMLYFLVVQRTALLALSYVFIFRMLGEYLGAVLIVGSVYLWQDLIYASWVGEVVADPNPFPFFYLSFVL